MMRRTHSRFAFTLIELAVVMAVLGVVAVAATSMLGASRVNESLQARNQADVLVNTMRMARATSITYGIPVRVEAIVNRKVIGFRVVEPLGKLANPETYYPDSLDCNWSARFVEFQPTGMTDKSLQISFGGDSSDWILDVLSASGQVILTKRNN